jgi:hypothetical protein
MEVSGQLHPPPPPHYPLEKSLPYPLDRRLGGPQVLSGRYGEENWCSNTIVGTYTLILYIYDADKDFVLYSTILSIQVVHWNFSGGPRENYRNEVADVRLLQQSNIKKKQERIYKAI